MKTIHQPLSRAFPWVARECARPGASGQGNGPSETLGWAIICYLCTGGGSLLRTVSVFVIISMNLVGKQTVRARCPRAVPWVAARKLYTVT